MMESNQLIEMVGLLPAYVPPTNNNAGFVIVGVALLLIVFIVFKRPYLILCHKINNNKISPRLAAHSLSTAKTLSTKQKSKLNTMRFSQLAPTKKQILSFIKSINKHD